jgi:hypothetical protein
MAAAADRPSRSGPPPHARGERESLPGYGQPAAHPFKKITERTTGRQNGAVRGQNAG